MVVNVHASACASPHFYTDIAKKPQREIANSCELFGHNVRVRVYVYTKYTQPYI